MPVRVCLFGGDAASRSHLRKLLEARDLQVKVSRSCTALLRDGIEDALVFAAADALKTHEAVRLVKSGACLAVYGAPRSRVKALQKAGATVLASLDEEQIALALGEQGKGRVESAAPDYLLFEGLFEFAPDAILVIDDRGSVARMNGKAESLFGFQRSELVGRPMEMLMPERFRAQHVGHRQGFQKSPHMRKMGTGMELFARRKDGSEFPVDISLGPLQTPDGIRILCIARDITEQKETEAILRRARQELGERLTVESRERARAEKALEQSEEQLRQAQKMEAIGRLAGGIAHDFNNLLTVIKVNSEMALEELYEDHPVRHEIESVVKASEKAESLTRQLLAFSRRQVLQPRLLDLNLLVTNIERMFRRLIGEDVEFVTRLGSSLGSVVADPGQIEQVIMNLVVNSRDAMPHGGKIILETRNVELDENYSSGHFEVRPGSYVLLMVSDTGIGMDVETQKHIFEPFFTTKEQGRGTGLGLSTVYGIVKQSGGHVWVYSEPGQGTTFKIYLPVAQKGTAEEAAAVEAPIVRRGTETVLLVEDADMVRDLARRILQKNGYRVLEARSGADALVICREHAGPIDLLFSDVIMPGMNGAELAREAARLRPELRVLFMSGYTDDVIVHHGVLEKGTSFLQKPFSPESLARKLREVLDEG